MADELAEKILAQMESCQQALKRLEEALGYAGKDIPGRLDVDAAIQRFEFCFEWIEYVNARNLTVHTYDESIADSVYETAKRFTQDAAALIASAEKALRLTPNPDSTRSPKMYIIVAAAFSVCYSRNLSLQLVVPRMLP
jgi:uncharacterized protein with HEPN domain